MNNKQTKKNEALLTRYKFREGVFARDHHKCVFCDEKDEVFAHHIMERRLFDNGGYYLSNGATVCDKHHRMCEMTVISVEEVRRQCGIEHYILPEHLYYDVKYDKWGNIILPDGTRTKGELFHDSSVQSILKTGDVLHLFRPWVKYPRTYHVPWSPGMTSDDRKHPDMTAFLGKRVIVTEKMDGECTTMYTDHFHARSIDSNNHPSRNRAKAFWGSIQGNIPEGWRICGENLYARHSIEYSNLPQNFFMGFSIWDENNQCLSYDDTIEWFELLDIEHTPVIYDGIFHNDKHIQDLIKDWDMQHHEGYVIRIADSFPYAHFRHNVGKYVRKDHVTTDAHWGARGKFIPNKCR